MGSGYIDLMGYEEAGIPFSMDRLKINFLKYPIKSLRRACIRYLHDNSEIGRETIENPGSWRILDHLYGNEPIEETGTFTPKTWADKMFYDSKAAKATKARFQRYIEEMKIRGEEYARERDGRVRILSLASGPGRDVIEVTEELRKRGIDVFATCVDQCKEAMELGSRIAKRRGLGNINFKRYRINKMNSYENGNLYDIVITQGIMDYLGDETGTFLLKNSKDVSSDGGTTITSNMDIHRWMRFWMETFGGWKLKYRNGEALKKLFLKAGFDEDKITLTLLPEGYHWIGIGKR
jgi:hypothetical protein